MLPVANTVFGAARPLGMVFRLDNVSGCKVCGFGCGRFRRFETYCDDCDRRKQNGKSVNRSHDVILLCNAKLIRVFDPAKMTYFA